MSEHIKNKVSPETLSEVIRSSEGILRLMGVEKPDMASATVPLDITDLTEAPEGAMPSITINKPKNDLAKQARWSYEITYGMQDPSASRHVLVMNSEQPDAEMAFYDGTPDRPLTEAEAQIVASDLTRIATFE